MHYIVSIPQQKLTCLTCFASSVSDVSLLASQR